MRTDIRDYPNPTLAMVAADLRAANNMGDVTEADICKAARNRGVTIKDGRVPYDGLGDIYLEIYSWRNK